MEVYPLGIIESLTEVGFFIVHLGKTIRQQATSLSYVPHLLEMSNSNLSLKDYNPHHKIRAWDKQRLADIGQ